MAPTREAKTPKPMKDDARWSEIEKLLEPTVKHYTGDPDNPWAIAHGYLVYGEALTVWDGRLAIDHLYERFANVDAVGLVSFPQTDGTIRVEPHPELLLKSIEEAGFDPGRQVVVDGKTVTLRDHYRGALERSVFDVATKRSSFSKPNDMPWAVQALAGWAPATDLQWNGKDDTKTSLDELTSLLVSVLVKETQFLADANAKGESFERTGQGLFAYTCGGAHLLQGAAYAVARGFGTPEDRAAIEAQVAIHFYRYPIERDITVGAMKAMPEHAEKLLVQRLKFSGHFLESMHKLAALGFYTPDAAQQKVLEGAAVDVLAAAKELHARKMLGDLDAIRLKDEQLFLDIVGDSAHALKGLRLARGQASVRY